MFWETPKAMSFEEYVAKTEASTAKYMGSDEYEFKIIDHAVFNGSVEKSIACYKKSNDEYVKSSFFHLQGFYMTYCNLCRLDYPSSKAFDSSMKQLSDRFKKVMENSNDNLTFNSDGINIKDYNTVKDGLHLQICNAEKNKVYLDDKPHYDLDDLSVFACSTVLNNGHTYLFPIYTNYLKMWNITPDVLFNDAHDCDIEKHKAFLISPETYDKHILVPIPKEDYQKYKFVALKNDTQEGASAILTAGDLLDHFAKANNCDLWMLPESVNEFVVVPKSAFPNYSFYNMTCAFIDYNVQNVDVEDDLSEHIYVYEKDSRCLMNPIDKKVVINYQNPDFPWDS